MFLNGEQLDTVRNNLLYMPLIIENMFSEVVITARSMKILKYNDVGKIYENNFLLVFAVREIDNLY